MTESSPAIPSPRVVAIIQARTGSARLPGKVLSELAGMPVVWHVVTRLGRCSTIDEVVVATSDQPGDDELEAYVSGLGIKVVRGSEANVLERIAKAARVARAAIIVRVTGDAPLVDPASVDEQVRGLLDHSADFCIYDQDAPNINEGFEAFTLSALAKLVAEAADDPVAREHTCTYFKNNPGFVKTVHLPVQEELRYQGARVSVDTPSDLKFLNLLHERLGAGPGEIDIRDVVRLLRHEPKLTKINASVHQKIAGEASRTAIIRCDASPAIGLGHLVRCLALADVLRDEKSFGITFVTRPTEVAERMIAHHRHRHIVLNEESDSWMQLENHLATAKSDVLVLDVREGTPRSVVDGMRERTGVYTVDIDDPEEKRLACDLVFNPPVPQVERMDWTALHGEMFAGWDYVLLRRQFHAAHQKRLLHPQHAKGIPTLLVTMGGSDPAGMSVKAAGALQGVTVKFHAIFVLGPSFCHEQEFQKTIAQADYSYEIQRGVEEMGSLMLRADLALACFSVTAYELATVGVPGIFLSLSEDHHLSSTTFAEAGIGVTLGIHDQVSEKQIALGVNEILQDASRRMEMSQRALVVTDGLGAVRIADQIILSLDQCP